MRCAWYNNRIMKVIVASFQCESNSFAKLHPQREDFEYFEGADIFRKLVVKDIFESAGIETVPSVYAVALPSATVTEDVYFYYEKKIEETVRLNADADGIYIYFHGSMEVENIGSGERYLLEKIRGIVSDKCVIALTFDAHANVHEDIAKYANIVCGYKTVPHTDQPESQARAAKALVSALKSGTKPVTYVQRVPFLLKNDTLLTGREPLKSLVEKTKKLEEDEAIYAANLFLGHCWIDAPNTCATTAVSAVNAAEAERTAKMLADELWATRKAYKFDIEALSPEECVVRAAEGKENRIFVTDSGDNTTAGAEGESTQLLNLFLKSGTDKPTCIAGITDAEIVNGLWNKKDGETVCVEKFGNRKAMIKSHGEILGWTKEIIGRSLTLSFGNVDAVFTELRSAFIEKGNFDKANVDLLSYRIVAVKLGYLFTELKPYADRELFALSDGASCVELERLNLKKIIRPMYPLDDFEWRA